MVEFNEAVFVSPNKQLDASAEVIFVSDMFVEDYVGGAELTSEALIEESPLHIQKLHSRDVNLSALEQGHQKFWVFGNFSQLNAELIPTIIANMMYAVLEYDYKYCRFRSPEKHAVASGSPCDCHNSMNGKLVSAFYHGATSLWWMSEAQKQRYLALFPFLSEKDNIVLSSVFSKNTLGTIQWLRNQVSTSSQPREGWIVLGSKSWVKGFEAAEQWCTENHKSYSVIWDRPYDEVLDRLARAEGFVYLPVGADTCPRMVIEAKLLGCNLQINDNVQHSAEDWFNGSPEEITDYLYAAPALFWAAIKKIINYKPSISGYTTTYNCISQKYPFVQCITSMLGFCDEVCVVDGGSSDGTWKALKDLASKEPKIKLRQVGRDWKHPRFAVYDGMQKAESRAMCTSDFCWQMDSDEIVHEDDYQKIIGICSKIPKNVDIVSLPVIEYWGGPDKVRLDIQPWKWRLSRNLSYITHGIPIDLCRVDSDGDVFAAPGSDGCDMIHKTNGTRLPHMSFHTRDAEVARQHALQGSEEAMSWYQNWFNDVVKNLPGVHHYSWFDLPRKIKLYRDYWTAHWLSLTNQSVEDTADNNMMFDVPRSQVTDEMIEKRASELSAIGGWIWHRKWDGSKTPWMTVDRPQPRVML